uniref:long-chain-fatty-acid--CoA ligase n=1 Tax=Strigamia maritima TaxID=126957 RepID=T1II87_STRMM
MNSLKNVNIRSSKRKHKKLMNGQQEMEIKVEENGHAIASADTKKDSDAQVTRKEMVDKLVAAHFEDSFVPKHQQGPDYLIPSESFHCWSPDSAKKLKCTEQPLSIVTYLRNSMDKFPNNNALSIRRNGKWIKWTYTRYWQDVCTAAKGFIKLGLEPFKSVAVLGFNAPEWVISYLAAAFAGGFGTGIYTTNLPEACWYILNDSKASIVVVENDHQLKKILEIRHRLPCLNAIIQYSGQPTEPDVLSWEDLMKIGNSMPYHVLEKRIKSIAINQCWSLVYTSGTTGVPKGVMLCHDTYTFVSRKLNERTKTIPGSEIVISYLPLSHVAAQVVDVFMGMGGAVELCFAPPEVLKGSLVDFLKEVQPTRFLGVPRVYEKIHEKILEAEESMKSVKKSLFAWARHVALANHTCKTNGPSALSSAFLFQVANRTILRKVREALGFHNVVVCASGAAPLSREVLDFFQSLNLTIFETYGLSECCAHSINTDGRFGSCGTILPELEAKIVNPDADGNGEICIGGRNILMGYFNQKEKTEEAIDAEGFFHTGDIGCFDNDKFLYVTGRIKELIITAGGENVAPLPIEERFKAHLPIISNCVLVGDKKKFLSILLTLKTLIDTNTLEPKDELAPISIKWCQSIGSDAKCVKDVLQGPDSKIMSAIEEGMKKVNQDAISRAQKVQKWFILCKDFSIAGGELGPTLKLKRSVVMNKYKQEIDALYAG